MEETLVGRCGPRLCGGIGVVGCGDGVVVGYDYGEGGEVFGESVHDYCLLEFWVLFVTAADEPKAFEWTN